MADIMIMCMEEDDQLRCEFCRSLRNKEGNLFYFELLGQLSGEHNFHPLKTAKHYGKTYMTYIEIFKHFILHVSVINIMEEMKKDTSHCGLCRMSPNNEYIKSCRKIITREICHKEMAPLHMNLTSRENMYKHFLFHDKTIAREIETELNEIRNF